MSQNPRSGGGNFGYGESLDEAKKKHRKNGGKIRGRRVFAFKFTSKLPFAPQEREANEDEADAFVSVHGQINWVRCEREEIEL